jgi:hypothetical protein
MLKKIIPVILIVLPIVALVLIRTFSTNRFRPEAEKPVELSAGKSNIINPENIPSLEGRKLLINLSAGAEAPAIEGIEQVRIQPGTVLSRENLKLFGVRDRKVLLWSDDKGVAARTWMLLTQMGYRDIFILSDGTGTEVFKSEFRPDTTSAAGILKE